MGKYRPQILNTSISRKKILESEVVLGLISMFILVISIWKKVSLLISICPLVLAIIYCVVCEINCKESKTNIEGKAAVICISTLKICVVILFVWMCIVFLLRNIDGEDLLRSVVATCLLLLVCTILKAVFTVKKIKQEQETSNLFEQMFVFGSNVAYFVVMISMFGINGMLIVAFIVVVVGIKILSELLAGAIIELHFLG